MKTIDVHPFDIGIEQFKSIQDSLSKKVSLKNSVGNKSINFCAGVDLAYWQKGQFEYAVCCILIIDYTTGEIIEKTYSTGQVTVPYIPGYLAFRELPLIIKAAKKLAIAPDFFLFDGNGYLHPRHMGIATHASFFLGKPTIGVAKSYLKIDDADYKMPLNKAGAYEDIIVNNEVYGRTLRTHENVKPIFVSCGNDIDLKTATTIVLKFINEKSRLPVPIRMADLETKKMRWQLNGREGERPCITHD